MIPKPAASKPESIADCIKANLRLLGIDYPSYDGGPAVNKNNVVLLTLVSAARAGKLGDLMGMDYNGIYSLGQGVRVDMHDELIAIQESMIRKKRELYSLMREDARTQVPKMVRPVGTTWRDAGFPCKLADFQGEACGGTCDWVAGVLGIFDESDGSDGKFSDLCRRKLFDRLSSTQFSAPCSKCRKGTLFRLEVI